MEDTKDLDPIFTHAVEDEVVPLVRQGAEPRLKSIPTNPRAA
jgi:hypothetical protein